LWPPFPHDADPRTPHYGPKMPSRLNADELGKKGQLRFQEICADAKLVCNEAHHDRTGWDFIVEFPFAPLDASTSLDERATPLSCHVQVKTLLEKNDRCKLRLSSAERLAKEPKPSFIYVLKVNAVLEFTGAYLIHVLDGALATILERLRKEVPAPNKGPNKKTISLSARKYGTPLAPTGDLLRISLQAVCGKSMSAYIANKAQQLDTLGFGPNRYELKTTLTFESDAHLVDAFLGLAGNIPATVLAHSEIRFGIRKPVPMAATEGLLTIIPRPVDSCTITVRADALSTPAVFRAKVLYPIIPNLPREQLKFVLDADLFQVHLSVGKWQLTSHGVNSPMTPKAWASYWRFAQVIANGAGTLEVSSDTLPLRCPLEITSKPSSLDPKECAHWLKLSERASAVLTAGGVLEEPNVSLLELHESTAKINSLFAVLNPHIASRPAIFKTESNDQLTLPGALEVLYADFLTLGPVAIGYYGVGSFLGAQKGNYIEWKCERIELKRIMRFNTFPKEYEQMLESAQAEVKHQGRWFWKPDP
jgi:hypothetical protein